MKTLLACLIAIWLTSCTTISSECAWAERIVVKRELDPDLSRLLAEQIVAHNRNVREFCR